MIKKRHHSHRDVVKKDEEKEAKKDEEKEAKKEVKKERKQDENKLNRNMFSIKVDFSICYYSIALNNNTMSSMVVLTT